MKRRRRRPNLRSPEPIDFVIDRAGEDRFALHRDPITPRVWRDTVGARIADRAKPITLERGILAIRCATSVWASELSMLSDTLLARLRAAGVQVRELRFRVGAIEPPARPPERRITRRIPPPAALPTELAEEVARVEDDELRASITAAARANLAWQKHVTEGPLAREAPDRAIHLPPVAQSPAPRPSSRLQRPLVPQTKGQATPSNRPRSGPPPARPNIPIGNAPNEGPRGARAPRDAETRSAPPARTSRAFPGAGRGNREDE